jgi:nucleoside phosphorylase
MSQNTGPAVETTEGADNEAAENDRQSLARVETEQPDPLRHGPEVASAIPGSATPAATKDHVDQADIVLVTVNSIETEELKRALIEVAGKPRRVYGRVNTYMLYPTIDDTTVATVRSSIGSRGAGGAGFTVYDAVDELRPWGVVAVGIAFGFDEVRQPIGQLLLSAQLTDYEIRRVGTSSKGTRLDVHRGPTNDAPPRLFGRFRDGGLDDDLGMDVKAGEVLTGDKLVDNLDFRAALLAEFPEAIGGEMEGAGVQAAAHRQGTEWLVAKAVCDYGVNKGEQKSARQQIAARKSASAVVHLLREGALRPAGRHKSV